MNPRGRHEETVGDLHAIEVCAGAGGQSLGLHRAGFIHDLAVELDPTAAQTLAVNLARLRGESVDEVFASTVRVGDVADDSVWSPTSVRDVDLLAGGVPCPPFSLAGRQLGATDERDLFAWAVELAGLIKPKALLLENVRGLAGTRFSGYRQAVADRLAQLGYWSQWRLLHAADFGVPQLRPRFVLVALATEYVPYFDWPVGTPTTETVGTALLPYIASEGWSGAEDWAVSANTIAPTIVGGSKRHGGADLGPTRAKKAWSRLGVDAHGVADSPPTRSHMRDHRPKLTCDMVARLQGWNDGEYYWEFAGRKTSKYRQIGNAFPPPMARAVGEAIARALRKEQPVREAEHVVLVLDVAEHDVVYRMLRDTDRHLTADEVVSLSNRSLSRADVERRIDTLQFDFVIDQVDRRGERAYRLMEFKAFRGQPDHERQESFARARAKIS